VFYKSWVVSEPDTISNENQSESYIVQISGEVLKPGVYQVEEALAFTSSLSFLVE
jgi:DMSO/TMAO reductase YedYZ molybdopterin-dependent catalytic subunit